MKRNILTIGLLLFASVAGAQELNLKVSPSEANTIWNGLQLSNKEIEALMTKLRQQVQEQTQPATTQPKPEVKLEGSGSGQGGPGAK